jgi:creatinine amidohydrolase/Fe(II)-dependent formamide hydrolase-like protein
MRSHIRHVILLPPTNHNGKSISNQIDNVIVVGDPTFHEFIVGVAKSMDSHGFDRTVGPFSSP